MCSVMIEHLYSLQQLMIIFVHKYALNYVKLRAMLFVVFDLKKNKKPDVSNKISADGVVVLLIILHIKCLPVFGTPVTASNGKLYLKI